MDTNIRNLLRLIMGAVGICVIAYGLLTDRKWVLLGAILTGIAMLSSSTITKLPVTKIVKVNRT